MARLLLRRGALLPLLLLSACATTQVGQDRLAERDPLEKINRGVWGVNQAADKVVVKPVTQVYRAVVPKQGRRGVSNFFANLTEPWSFVNNLLQGKINRAGDNLGRFIINTTVGIAGLFDHATRMGIKPAPEDFGQTLAHYGVNGGPYLVLPLLGPSTLRDGVGSGVAFFGDPVNIALDQSNVSGGVKLAYRVGQVIDARAQLIESGGDAFLQTSLDPYAAARSAYLQRRRAQIESDGDETADTGGGEEGAAQPAQEAVPTPAGDATTAPGTAAPPEAPPADSAPVTPTPAPADQPGA